MFGDLRKEVGEAISKLCKMEGVTIIKVATTLDHVHMYVSIPPKMSVSKKVGRIKEKAAGCFLTSIRNTGIDITATSGQEIIIAKPSVM